MEKYKLDLKKSLDYFNENLKNTNKLSNTSMAVLNAELGSFYAFLPKDAPIETIHEFNFGGKTPCLRGEVSLFIETILKSNKTLSCIFDDFNADFSNKEPNDLYESNGLHYLNEIYYVANESSPSNIIEQCLNYSSAIWHSLCIITKYDFDEIENKNLTDHAMDLICANAHFIIIEAYDAESYVLWEREVQGTEPLL